MTSGDDAGARKIAQEDEEDGDHEADADKQVVQHVVSRDMHEVRALVEYADLHPFGQEFFGFDFRHLGGNGLGGRQRLFVFSHHHDAFDDVVLGTAADDTLARLVADDHLGDLLDVDGSSVGRRRDHDVADVIQFFGFNDCCLRDVRGVERVVSAAQEPDGPDVV